MSNSAPGRLNGRAGDLLDDELSGPPVLDRRSPRVAEIVEAARRILEADGPGALTMRRVGDELGIRAPSLYKHFRSKAELEAAILEDALEEIGTASHEALRSPEPLHELLGTYRRYAGAHPHLYRLATSGPLDRDQLTPGLEAWAGNPWFVVMGDPALAQALWSFAHGMVILELDGRYPPESDLDATWRSGAAAFQAAARSGLAGTSSVAQT
jgi:AcrR family transcriptional regulator